MPCKRKTMDNTKQRKRCGAKTRSGTPCQNWGMENGRCRMHGGKAGRPITHGRYSVKHRASLQAKMNEFLDDPQPGNIPGGPRDTMAAEDFNTQSSLVAFGADSGTWSLEDGKLVIAPASLGMDAASVYHLKDSPPGYFERRDSMFGHP